MRRILMLLLGVLAMCTVTSMVLAMAEENFGNAPLNPLNYQDWKGVMPIINHPSRVYHTWVNGNEHFYYRGGTEALNDALSEFSAVQADVREVILLPGSGIITSFFKDKRIPYDWNLHIMGGISQRQKERSNVWDKYPTIRVFIGDNINLQKMQIPKGVTVKGLADLRQRYLEGLETDDREARAYAAYFLAKWDSHNKKTVPQITTLLDDEDKWVRDMATSALKKIRQAIAEEEATAAEKRRAMETRISQFLKSLPRDGEE